MTDYGIDLSRWNALADAHAVRANGITYAWCKATEGVGWVDPTFANKVRQLRDAGIVVGGYAFLRAGDAAAQARHFRQVAGDHGCLNVGALMPMADMESADVRGSANAVVNGFYDTLGIEPMDCYGNLDWWRNALRPGDWGARNILGHIARYNGDPGNPGWSYNRMAVHQHTSTGTVPGVPGNCDRNATMAGWSLQAITIGNVLAPPPPQPPPTPPPAGDSWVVKPGDTLSRIASAWNTTVSAVAAFNGIPDPDLIYVGQVIRKPPAGAGPAPGGGSYTVVAGDTLSEIAAAHGTSVAVLVALNHISNPDRIFPGQVIQLPSGPASAPAPAPAPAERFYVVKPNDTLGRIAAELGYPGGYQALAARNGIPNPNLIRPGQRIYY